MKKVLLALVAAIMVLFVVVNQQEQNTIIIYSSLEQFRNDALMDELNQEFPDLNIMIMYIPTAKAAAKIQTEKENSDADIIVALETSYMEKIKDSLAPVSQYSNLPYANDLPKDTQYLVWERYGGGFAVNTEILKKYHLPEPSSYEDLLKPEYKNQIVIPDPKSSGTGFNFYLNMQNERGLDAALQYFDKLNSNVKQYSESGSGPVKMLVQGECAVGFALTYQVVNEINRGNPLKMVYPKEGSPYSLSGLGMVKGKETNKDVVRVFKFIANKALPYDKEHFNPEKILTDQVNTIQNYPKGIEYADMKGIENLKLKDELLSKWKY